MATVGGTAMASAFEQVRMAKDLLKPDKNCVLLIIGNTGYNHRFSDWLSRNSCPDDNYVVVVTGSFDDLSGTVMNRGRAWVSKNSLRKLDGCIAKVVWIVDSTRSSTSNDEEFVDVVFKKQRGFVVVIEIDNNSFKLKHDTGYYEVNNAVSLTHDCVSVIGRLPPSVITVRSADIKADKLEIWDSENMILFGKTGSGKSTIAQMLTSGEVRIESYFKSGSGAKGVTEKVTRGQGRGWHVTDTPGFGETKDGSVPTREATKRIAKFIRETCGVYSHFVYVFKWSRLDAYDERLWSFFQQVFNKAEANFTVIVTNRSEDLSDEDKATLRKTFDGCDSFICVDFPSVAMKREIEKENEEVRNESLEKLERELASLGRSDKVCLEGKQSEARMAYTMGNVNAEANFIGSVGDLATRVLHHLVVKPAIRIKGMTRTSVIDENFMLLPQ